MLSAPPCRLGQSATVVEQMTQKGMQYQVVRWNRIPVQEVYLLTRGACEELPAVHSLKTLMLDYIDDCVEQPLSTDEHGMCHD